MGTVDKAGVIPFIILKFVINADRILKTDVLPCVQFLYSEVLDYVNSETELRNSDQQNTQFAEHAKLLYSRANQRFELMKQTCHFVNDQNKRKVLYINS